MPKKNQSITKTKRGKLPEIITKATQTGHRTWANVVNTMFKPKSWSDWTNEQLNNNKMK